MWKKVLNKNIFELKTLVKSFPTAHVHSNVLVSESSAVNIPDITLPEFIIPKLEKYEKYTVLECGATGRSYTYKQFRSKSKNFNKALRHIFKLKKGDLVAILLPNKPEYAVAAFGVVEAGMILTTLNPIYTPEEIHRQLIDSSASLLITQTQSVQTAKEAVKLTKKHIPIIAIKSRQDESVPRGTIDFEELVNSNIDIQDPDYGKSSDLMFLPYSSGTTGLPKGVELTHSNIVANLSQVAHKDFNYFEETTDNFQDVTTAILPFFHIYGFVMNFMNMVCHGAKVVTVEKFSPESFISVLKKHPVSLLYGAPPLVLFLASHNDVKSEYLQNLKMFTSGAAPLGVLDEERLIKKVGPKVKMIQGYGLTETSPIITYLPRVIEKTKRNGGSVGKPVPNTMIKIVSPDDPTGRPLGPKEKGEVLIKGPQVMRGYHKREEESRNAFLDGWFKTGDIGFYDDDKLLFITDRIKELIKVKGFQVAPAELEEIIRDLPSIEDVAVIGIPHVRYGEIPRAYVVPKKNTIIDVEGLKKHVAEKVAPYKTLEGGVRILEVIPKNLSGKILRRKLKNDFAEKGI